MKTILLIEDNTEVRENTAEILELAQYKVLQAENGKKGVELANTKLVDLIICDIMMPVLDGYGVIHLLSKNPKTAAIPFIFLTAKSEKNDFRKGMEMGADDYVTKPFDDIELLKAVEGRLKKSDALKKEYSRDENGINTFMDDAKSILELKSLSDSAKVKKYKKKELIYSEGFNPNYLFLLQKGKVKTFRSHEYGKELITTLLKEGDFFGYTSLLDEIPYHESAEAIEDSSVVLIPKEDFYALLNNNVGVMKKFIKLLSNDVEEKEQQLIKMAYSSVKKRVAEALVKLEKQYKINSKDKFNISISREDLANIVGTATESLIRTLSDFKHENLIEIKGSNITILDIEKFENYIKKYF
ncbi:MAG: response regulator [Bacteroidota bacterium]|jgi:CRP-like cAMP-binding protein/CheY-like chemotaxis protein